MERDMLTYQKWEDWHRKNALETFEKEKTKAINDALVIKDTKGRETSLKIAQKMRFQFDKSGLLNYGNCTKFDKLVLFIPNVCQLETQNCFVHRREN